MFFDSTIHIYKFEYYKLNVDNIPNMQYKLSVGNTY